MLEKANPWQRPQTETAADNTKSENPDESAEPRIARFWESMRRWGLGAPTLRIATATLTVLLILVIVWVMDAFYIKSPNPTENNAPIIANAEAIPTLTLTPPAPSFFAGGSDADGIDRSADLHTVLPLRLDRYQVTQYTVESGDNIFSIAEKFNLLPESILWGNRYTLGDDPHFIVPGQVLNILPVDGVYHRWSSGEGLNGVSDVYGVTPEDIINWEGNGLDPEEIGDYANPNIPENTMLIIPGGKGAYPDFRTPRISRNEPATAKNLGPGACVGSFDGITGSQTFIWPTSERYLSGYDYSPETNHFAIDIAGKLGNPIYAADSGVIVYAGWNDYGYGEMVVIDHGYGWQTLYAHLSQVNVGCGQEVYQGDTIGLMGSTGKSSGPHLHFEMRNDEYGRVNPWDFLQ